MAANGPGLGSSSRRSLQRSFVPARRHGPSLRNNSRNAPGSARGRQIGLASETTPAKHQVALEAALAHSGCWRHLEDFPGQAGLRQNRVLNLIMRIADTHIRTLPDRTEHIIVTSGEVSPDYVEHARSQHPFHVWMLIDQPARRHHHRIDVQDAGNVGQFFHTRRTPPCEPCFDPDGAGVIKLASDTRWGDPARRDNVLKEVRKQ